MIPPSFNLRFLGGTPQTDPKKTIPKSSWRDGIGPICSGKTVRGILRWQPEKDTFAKVLRENLPYQEVGKEGNQLLVSNAPSPDAHKYMVDLRMDKQTFLSALPTLIGFFNSANIQHGVSKRGDEIMAWFTSAKTLNQVVPSLKRVIQDSEWGQGIFSRYDPRTISVRSGDDGPRITAMPLLRSKSLPLDPSEAKAYQVRGNLVYRVEEESHKKPDFSDYKRFQKLKKKAAAEKEK